MLDMPVMGKKDSIEISFGGCVSLFTFFIEMQERI